MGESVFVVEPNGKPRCILGVVTSVTECNDFTIATKPMLIIKARPFFAHFFTEMTSTTSRTLEVTNATETLTTAFENRTEAGNVDSISLRIPTESFEKATKTEDHEIKTTATFKTAQTSSPREMHEPITSSVVEDISSALFLTSSTMPEKTEELISYTTRSSISANRQTDEVSQNLSSKPKTTDIIRLTTDFTAETTTTNSVTLIKNISANAEISSPSNSTLSTATSISSHEDLASSHFEAETPSTTSAISTGDAATLRTITSTLSAGQLLILRPQVQILQLIQKIPLEMLVFQRRRTI